MSPNPFRAGRLVITVWAALLLASPVAAGTTGKLSGKVVNEKNEPLAGVNIRIEGQRLGAISDEKGDYFIIGIPAGTYEVRANLMGEAPFVAENVVITPDFTTALPIAMKVQAVEMQEVKVEAERPLLQKYATGTTRFISSQDIDKLPTRGYRDAAAQQTGVVNFQKQIDNESQNGNTLIVRGGRPNEIAYFVDGFSQQDPLTGTSSTAIGNSAIDEVVVMTGGFAPEYGRIMSGAVNVVTKEGSKKYSGTLEALSDALSGQWIDAPVTDYNIYSGSLGGPVLPNHDNLTFYLSGERRWQRDRNPGYMTPGFEDFLRSQNLNTDVKPGNSSGAYSFQGKLSWQINEKMSLRGGALGSQDRWQEFLQPYLYNMAHMPRYLDRNQSYFATFNHVLSTKTFWDLGFNYFETLRKRGDGVAFDNLSQYFNPFNPRFDPNLPMFWQAGHTYNNYLQRDASYWGLQGSMTSQVNVHNQVKWGGDFQRHKLRYFQHYRPTLLGTDFADGINAPDNTNWDGYGYKLVFDYDPAGNVTGVHLVDEDSGKDGAKHPQTWSAFVQDKYEREGVIVNAGLRYDYINTDTPALTNDVAPLEGGPYPDQLDSQDLTSNKVYQRLSPRLGVAFPLDEKTILRFNYGQFYQQPNLQDLYVSYRFLEYKLQSGGYYAPIGNPNLRPEQTTAYEVGVARQIGDRMRFDMTAYYKDVKDLVSVNNIPTAPGALSKSYASFRNTDFATIKGVDAGFTMRRMNHISGSVNYSLAYAQGTGSVSNSHGNIAWTASNPPHQTAPLDFDQRHKLSFNMDLTLDRGEGPKLGSFRPLQFLGINVLYNIASGTPYTPTEVYNEITLASVSSQPSGPINSRYGPWTQSLDLKVNRAFPIAGSTRLEAFLWALNVLNARNVYTVYTSSGSAQTTNWLNTNDGRDYLNNAALNGLDGQQQYQLATDNPTFYGNPRLVRFGVRASF